MKLVILAIFGVILAVRSEAPYPPRGYKPTGQQFPLPGERFQSNSRPESQYGAPQGSQNGPYAQNQYRASQLARQNLNNYNTIDGGFRQFDKQQEDGQNFDSGPNKAYAPANPTKDEYRQRGYPEPTTKKPKQEEEPVNDEPNVSIATAVANGQLYFLHPSGLLERVELKKGQADDQRNTNENNAKLVYQNAPIFAYTAPLIRVN